MPHNILKIITKGASNVEAGDGWYAVETICVNDPIGDIYFRSKGKNKRVELHHYEYDSDPTYIEHISSSNDSWGDWENDIIPSLKPLNVSCISGFPRLIGWAECTFSPNHFLLPSRTPLKRPCAIEMFIASGCYTSIGRKLSGNKYHKP